jgi:hypothetical protein
MTIKEPKENLPVAWGGFLTLLIISQFKFNPSVKCSFLFGLAFIERLARTKAL